MFGVKIFHSYSYGHPFTLISDHKPLLSLFNEVKAVSPQASARIQRWALTLATYEYTMAYRQSADHGNADAMSRLPLPVPNSVPPAPAEVVLLMEGLCSAPVSASCVSRETERDPTLSRVQQFILSGWPEVVRDPELRAYYTKRLELSTQDGCILWGNRVVVPKSVQGKILTELHEGHPGVARMKRLARMFV